MGCSKKETPQRSLPGSISHTALKPVLQESCWPMWRGANSSGVAAKQQLPLSWSSTESVVWRVRVSGTGNSSPVVWKDRIFLTTLLTEADPAQLAIVCIDRTSGETLWQETIGPPLDDMHSLLGPAAASVATDGEALFAFFGSNGLYCFDLVGNKRWHHDLGPLQHDWGLRSSPLLVGPAVIQLCDHQGQSFLIALDKQSGKKIWKTLRRSYGNWSTPVLVRYRVDDELRTELVVHGTGTNNIQGGSVVAYHPADGSLLWHAAGTSDTVWPSLITLDDIVISSSGRNGPLFAIRSGGSGNVTDTHVLWKKPAGGSYIPTGLVYDKHLYLLNDTGLLTCCDPYSGEHIWETRLPGKFASSLVAGDGKIYATNDRGTTTVLAAGDKPEILSINELNQAVTTTCAIAEGQLILRTKEYLFCIANDSEAGDPRSARVTAEVDLSATPNKSEKNPGGNANTSRPVRTAEPLESDADFPSPSDLSDEDLLRSSRSTPRNSTSSKPAQK